MKRLIVTMFSAALSMGLIASSGTAEACTNPKGAMAPHGVHRGGHRNHVQKTATVGRRADRKVTVAVHGKRRTMTSRRSFHEHRVRTVRRVSVTPYRSVAKVVRPAPKRAAMARHRR